MRITGDQLTQFAQQIAGTALNTISRREPFAVIVNKRGLITYVPASTSKPRVHSAKALAGICDRFSRTNSLRPSDYKDLSAQASYTLFLIREYMNRDASKEAGKTPWMSRGRRNAVAAGEKHSSERGKAKVTSLSSGRSADIERTLQRLRTVARSSPDLVLGAYEPDPRTLNGHCYVLCQSLYFLYPGVFTVHRIEMDGGSHYFLRTSDGEIVETLNMSFGRRAYEGARRIGFRNKKPVKRTVELLRRAGIKVE